MLQLDSLTQQDLASRLTLNCVNCSVEPHKLQYIQHVTIIDVFDEYALSSPVREEIYKFYPHAKLAHLKSGGNFPYLSRSDDINLHLQVRFIVYNLNLALTLLEWKCQIYVLKAIRLENTGKQLVAFRYWLVALRLFVAIDNSNFWNCRAK